MELQALAYMQQQQMIALEMQGLVGGKGVFGKAKGGGGKDGGAGPYGGKAELVPNDNLYVTGLPYDAEAKDVMELFNSFGPVVDCRVLEAKKPGQSRHALVRFATIEAAMKVRSAWRPTFLPGCTETLQLEFAAPKDRTDWTCMMCGDWQFARNEHCRQCGAQKPLDAHVTACSKGKSKCGKGMGKPGGLLAMEAVLHLCKTSGRLPAGISRDANAVRVANLPMDCTELHLYRLFSAFGPILADGVHVSTNLDGSCNGHGFVTFLVPVSAQAACRTLNCIQKPDGGVLEVTSSPMGGVLAADQSSDLPGSLTLACGVLAPPVAPVGWGLPPAY